MIYLFTGIPGAGKTLNAIKFVLEDSRFKNRNIYAHNITGLNIPEWQIIDQEQARDWYNLPDGSVVVIDECQDIWRPRKVGAPVPPTVQLLEKHRHQGIDLVLTCQFPRQIDTGVRRLVTNHFHLFRPFGMNTISQLKWEKCEDTPDDHFAKLKAVKSRLPIDAAMFDKYKSAEVHTVKRSIPKKMIFIPLGIVSLIIAIIVLVYTITGLGSSEAETQQIASTETAKDYFIRPSKDHVDPDLYRQQYLDLRQNVVENDPRSAPLFRQLLEPVSLPRPNCIYNHDTNKCVCYSQQSTRMKIDRDTCIFYIQNGYEFDYTKEDYIDKKNSIRLEREGATRVPDRIRIIQQSDNPKYPTATNSFAGIH